MAQPQTGAGKGGQAWIALWRPHRSIVQSRILHHLHPLLNYSRDSLEGENNEQVGVGGAGRVVVTQPQTGAGKGGGRGLLHGGRVVQSSSCASYTIYTH